MYSQSSPLARASGKYSQAGVNTNASLSTKPRDAKGRGAGVMSRMAPAEFPPFRTEELTYDASA
jgi:hypothetical protein